MDTRELLKKRADLHDKATRFFYQHSNENMTMTEEDAKIYDSMIAEIENLSEQLNRMEYLNKMDYHLSQPYNKPVLEQLSQSGNLIGTQRRGITSKDYHKGFFQAVRTGFKVFNDYLNEGVLSDGGYLCPAEFDSQIVSALQEANVLRQISKVITTQSTHKIPIVASKPAAAWIGEGDNINLATETFGQVSLEAHKLAVALKISNELLQDSFVNLEVHLAQEFGDSLARAEEEAFLTGTGEDNQPTGLLPTLAASATGTLQTTSTTLSADDLTTLIYSVDRPYRKSSAFLLSDTTLAHIRKLKDNTQAYLWTQNLTSSEPPQLLGFPVYTSNYMPAPTAGNIAVLFGDFSRFVIGDRGERTFRPLNELFALSDCTAFLMTERTDCVLTDNKAIRGLKIRVS